jgi:beta-lactamase superfamily II metal-dependent hydrolase
VATATEHSGITLATLKDFHVPAVQTNSVQPFTLRSIPNVTFTLLHSEAAPQRPTSSVADSNQQGSIVLMTRITSSCFLFTGDANVERAKRAGAGHAATHAAPTPRPGIQAC